MPAWGDSVEGDKILIKCESNRFSHVIPILIPGKIEENDERFKALMTLFAEIARLRDVEFVGPMVYIVMFKRQS